MTTFPTINNNGSDPKQMLGDYREAIQLANKQTMIVFKIIGFASGVPCPVAGQYLKEFDFEAHNGRGNAVFTDDINDALGFETSEAAFKFYRTVPANKPFREDGLPNRPMTASHWEFTIPQPTCC